jgi:hypothetical protein
MHPDLYAEISPPSGLDFYAPEAGSDTDAGTPGHDYWHSNDGWGLSDQHAADLAERLLKDIPERRAAAFAERMSKDNAGWEDIAEWERLILDFAHFCRHCGGFQIL